MKKLKNNKAFTMIELIVVVAIIGTLALLAGPKLLGYVEKAELARIKNDVKTVELLIDETIITNGSLPDSWALSGTLPKGKTYDKSGEITDIRLLEEGPYKVVNIFGTGNGMSVRSSLPGYFVANENGKVYYVSDVLSSKAGNKIANYESYMLSYYHLGRTNVSNLKRYDMVILEPRNANESPDHLETLRNSGTDIYAYQSIMGLDNPSIKNRLNSEDYITINGERPTHKYFKYEFGDIRSENYRNVLLDVLFEDVLSKGYDGVFFDTLDDVNRDVFRENRNPETGQRIRKELIEGYVEFLKLAKEKYPGLSIIQNRGFEVYQAGGAKYVDAIVFENFRHEDFSDGKLDWLVNGLQGSADDSNSIILALSYENPDVNYELAKKYNWIYTYYNSGNDRLRTQEKIYKNEYVK